MAMTLLASLHVGAGTLQAADAETNLARNGAFDSGVSHWMYHQWTGRRAPGQVTREDGPEGKSWFRMHDAGGGNRYMATEVPIADPGQDHVVQFWLKTEDVPAGAARVRVEIDGRGWLGSRSGKHDRLVAEGTQAWRAYDLALPASALGDAEKIRVFFYHDEVDQGAVGFTGLVVRPGQAEDRPREARPATLTGDTSEPEMSTFVIGQPVELTFRAHGLESGQRLALNVKVVDEHDDELTSQRLNVRADGDGAWQGTWEAPADRLGFYRVHAELANGVTLQGRGSRASGFLTYAVVPDPDARENFGVAGSRFGMQGGFGRGWQERSLRLLGARWILDGNFEWRKREPERAGQFREQLEQQPQQRASAGGWQTFSLPTFFAAPEWAVKPGTLRYMTGSLTEEGETAWDAYCRVATEAFMAKHPDDEQRIYQVTWEPIRPWGFQGTDEALVRIHEIAHQAIHDTDPRAVVAGPTMGVKDNELNLVRGLMELGLGEHIDAFSIHPYYPITPERDGMIDRLREARQMLRDHIGHDIPMIGTEQGWSTEEDPGKDLLHAQGLMRQNLITLGEGYQFNMAFYIVDYRLAGQSGYGYYYNLDEGVPWAPGKIAPRPIVPAFAAQSLLIDGHDPVRAIDWLGDETWGYAFEQTAEGEAAEGETSRGERVVLAVWAYGEQRREVTLITGVEEVAVYDWMGNAEPTPSPGGELTLTLGPEPVYITGASTGLWGRGGGQRLQLTESQWITTPGQPVTISARIVAPDDEPLDGAIQLETDPRIAAAPRQAVKLDAGQSTMVAFEVQLASDLEPGRYPGRLLLQRDGTTIDFAGVDLRIEPPVVVAAATPELDADGQAGLVVTLENPSPQTMEGTMRVTLRRIYPERVQSDLPMIDLDRGRYRVEGEARLEAEQRFSLDAGGRERVMIPVDPSAIGSVHRVLAEVELRPAGGGASYRDARQVNFLLASQLAEGESGADAFDAMRDQPPHAIDGEASVIRGEFHYAGSDDLAASLRLAWDAEALYLLIAVTDDAFHQPHHGDETWRGDALQLAFAVLDPAADADLEAGQATELALALTPDGPEAFRHLSFDTDRLPIGRITEGRLRTIVQRTDAGLMYELALPWASLGFGQAPQPGDRLGFAMTVNDADNATGQSDLSALGVFGGITPTKDPGQFGILLLAPPASSR